MLLLLLLPPPPACVWLCRVLSFLSNATHCSSHYVTAAPAAAFAAAVAHSPPPPPPFVLFVVHFEQGLFQRLVIVRAKDLQEKPTTLILVLKARHLRLRLARNAGHLRLRLARNAGHLRLRLARNAGHYLPVEGLLILAETLGDLPHQGAEDRDGHEAARDDATNSIAIL